MGKMKNYKKVLTFICNECGEETIQDNPEEYESLPEIVFEEDYGCPLCRQKKDGFTPYLTFVEL